MDTLLLDQTLWDLCLDSSGNIAMATEPYAIAQDVASAVRTFQGECWYNTTIGIPYFAQILGHFPPLTLVKSLIVNAAATVPGCGNPVMYVTKFTDRQLGGQVQFTDSNAVVQSVTFANITGPFILGVSSLGGPNVI